MIKSILVILFLFCLPSCAELKEEVLWKNISAVEAAKLIQENKRLVIIDVRTPKEFAEGRLANAKNIDWRASDFEQMVSQLDKKRDYLIHCKSGYRSGKAMAVFKKLGFESVTHLSSGYSGWIAEKYSVEK